MKDSILQVLVEIDHYIAAEDELDFGEDGVCAEVVLEEGDAVANTAVDDDVLAIGAVIIDEGFFASGLLVIGGVFLYAFNGEDAVFGDVECYGVNVGRIDDTAVQQAFFLQEYSEGMCFFSSGTPGVPDAYGGEGLEKGDDFFPDVFVDPGVPEHFGDRNGEVHGQLPKPFLIPEEPREHINEVFAVQLLSVMVESSAYGIGCILAIVVPVSFVDGFQNELDFQFFQLLLLFGLRKGVVNVLGIGVQLCGKFRKFPVGLLRVVLLSPECGEVC